VRRKFEIIMLVAAAAVAIAILAAGVTTKAGNHPLPIASHNKIDPTTLQLKVDIFNLQRATVDLPWE
jgi:hypothetical protein